MFRQLYKTPHVENFQANRMQLKFIIQYSKVSSVYPSDLCSSLQLQQVLIEGAKQPLYLLPHVFDLL